jgi:hypothetical protein
MYRGKDNGTAKNWMLFILLNIHNIEKFSNKIFG